MLPFVADLASIAGAIFSACALVGVLFVRKAVNTAVARQTALINRLRAATECRNLLGLLSVIRFSASTSDWDAVLTRSLDARRSAVELSVQLGELAIGNDISISGVISQLITLGRFVSKAQKKRTALDTYRIQNNIAKQEEVVTLILGRLERAVRETNVNRGD